MTGERLALILGSWGLEITNVEVRDPAQPHGIVVTCRHVTRSPVLGGRPLDVAEALLPYNVEVVIQQPEIRRRWYGDSSELSVASGTWVNNLMLVGAARESLTSMPHLPHQFDNSTMAVVSPPTSRNETPSESQEMVTGQQIRDLLVSWGFRVDRVNRARREHDVVVYHVHALNNEAALRQRPDLIPANVRFHEQARMASVTGSNRCSLLDVSTEPSLSQNRLPEQQQLPRRVDLAELRERFVDAGLEPQLFYWFTDAELRTLNKQPANPPWQRICYRSSAAHAASAVAQLLPSNVFLQVGDVTTTGLWGCREGEVFVAGPQSVQVPQSVQAPSGFRASVAVSCGDHIVKTVAYTAQNLASSQQLRRLDYDGLVALLRRHLGNDTMVLSIHKPGNEYRVQIQTTKSGLSISANNLPWNIVIWRAADTRESVSLRGTCESVIFDPRGTTMPVSSYFVTDGDTVTTPESVPPWLHSMVVEVRAKSASWQRRGHQLDITFTLPYGHVWSTTFQARVVTQVSGNCPSARPVVVSAVTAPPPLVPVCLVRAIRDRMDLAVLTPSPREQDHAQEWQNMPDNTQRLCHTVVADIIHLACLSLDDEAAAARASCYHVLIEEGKKRPDGDIDQHVHDWCEQFRTRAALLEFDDVRVPTSDKITHRTTKPVSAKQVRDFRDLWESRSGPQTATEAAQRAFVTVDKVSSSNSAKDQPDPIAVHILVVHCPGLSDETAAILTSRYHEFDTIEACDAACLTHLQTLRPQLELATPDPRDVARRQAQVAQQQRLRQVAEELERRRAVRVITDQIEASRFDLLEIDNDVEPPKPVKIMKSLPIKSTTPQRPAVTFAPPPIRRLDLELAPLPRCDHYIDASWLPEELRNIAISEAYFEAVKKDYSN